MRVLRVGLRLVVVRPLGQVVVAERRLDVLAHRDERLVGHADRVGSHVGDEAAGQPGNLDAALVQLLREHHRLLHREARRLLQLARDERRRRVALALLRRHRRDDPRRAFEVGEDRRSTAPRSPTLIVLAVLLEQLGVELRRLRSGEPREDVPVLFGHERFDLALAVAHELQRHRLHAAGAQAAADLVPEQRADLVADQTIEHAARALRADHLLVDRAADA